MELDLTHLLNNFGTPVAVLVAAGLALRSIAKFFAPLIQAGFERAFKVMDETMSNISQHTILLGGIQENLKTQNVKLEDVGVTLNHHGIQLDEYGNQLDEHGLLLSEIRGIYVKKATDQKPGDSGILKSQS